MPSCQNVKHEFPAREGRGDRGYRQACVCLLLFFSCIGTSIAQKPIASAPASYWGMMYSNQADFEPEGNLLRIWDDGLSWPFFETANGTWNSAAFSDLDTALGAFAPSGGAPAWMTLSRTPNWALAITGTCTSQPYQPACDPNCEYAVTGGTGTSAPGQCYPPSLVVGGKADLGIDGSGQDSIWKAWVTKIANHANGLDGNPGYLTSHAHIQYWEIWNEVDATGSGTDVNGHNYNSTGGYISSAHTSPGSASFIGTYAQLVRMAEDARCIIEGSSHISVIHNDPSVGQTTTCTQTGIDPTAQIVMPSMHSYTSVGTNTAQNFLYCSGSSFQGGKVKTTAPEECNTASDGAAAVDVINFHMKPGNALAKPTGDGLNGFNVEAEMTNEYCAVVGKTVSQCSTLPYLGVLGSNELIKLFTNGEAGYSGAEPSGWTGNDSGQSLDISNNPDYQASFASRYMLIQFALGIRIFNWYQFDAGNNLAMEPGGSLTEAGQAYNTTAYWMSLRSMSTPCYNISGTQWVCGIMNLTQDHTPYEFVWDTNYSAYPCTSSSDADDGASCMTYMSTVSSSWKSYYDMWGNHFPITGNQAPVGVIPILLSTSIVE